MEFDTWAGTQGRSLRASACVRMRRSVAVDGLYGIEATMIRRSAVRNVAPQQFPLPMRAATHPPLLLRSALASH